MCVLSYYGFACCVLYHIIIDIIYVLSCTSFVYVFHYTTVFIYFVICHIIVYIIYVSAFNSFV